VFPSSLANPFRPIPDLFNVFGTRQMATFFHLVAPTPRFGLITKIFLYDGKTGDQVAELSSAPSSHSGTVFSMSWNRDSTHMLTASADMTAKIWDVSAKQVVSSYSFADKPTFENQQVGCLWQGDYLISLSLSGDINYLDPRVSGKPSKVVKGTQTGLTSILLKDKTFYVGNNAGKVYAWDEHSQVSLVSGKGPTNEILGLGYCGDAKIVSAALDDSFRSFSISDNSFE
jgi:WD40 repeat protein